jgi:ribonuclease HI
MTAVAVVHLDESCLGNGREGDNPGGAAGLIEVRHRGAVERRDFYLSSPGTTNNRMALLSAITALDLLAGKGKRFAVLLVSDSEYLVKGVREWAPGWEARGWRRKGGAIENLPLWQQLLQSLQRHDAQFTWVRGHQGHAKNEYANDLAVRAAKELLVSDGAVPSGFDDWLDAKRAKGNYLEYDGDAAFEKLEERLLRGERFPLK